ncbi:hypothetical protein [Piscirickettsia salmonis]|nr:hypothetical protein [Piscirickettsia salmonis]QHS27756.1 hypothetical protein GW538_18030 [Piscirickettsia salmonis]
MPRAKITKVIVDEYVAGFQIGRPPQTKQLILPKIWFKAIEIGSDNLML